jgi:hypothetical protein
MKFFTTSAFFNRTVCIKSVFFIFTAVAAVAIASAAEMREIDLTDGSVITGEILSLSGDVYTVRSPALGTIRINGSKIRTIRSGSSADTASVDTGNGVKSLQGRMMSDSGIVDTIMSLQNDPDFQKILHDPDIMKAVQSGDVAALMANPQFMKLLNNKAVRKIGDRLAK